MLWACASGSDRVCDAICILAPVYKEGGETEGYPSTPFVILRNTHQSRTFAAHVDNNPIQLPLHIPSPHPSSIPDHHHILATMQPPGIYNVSALLSNLQSTTHPPTHSSCLSAVTSPLPPLSIGMRFADPSCPTQRPSLLVAPTHIPPGLDWPCTDHGVNLGAPAYVRRCRFIVFFPPFRVDPFVFIHYT